MPAAARSVTSEESFEPATTPLPHRQRQVALVLEAAMFNDREHRRAIAFMEERLGSDGESFHGPVQVDHPIRVSDAVCDLTIGHAELAAVLGDHVARFVDCSLSADAHWDWEELDGHDRVHVLRGIFGDAGWPGRLSRGAER